MSEQRQPWHQRSDEIAAASGTAGIASKVTKSPLIVTMVAGQLLRRRAGLAWPAPTRPATIWDYQLA
jgi:hypothetical protein